MRTASRTTALAGLLALALIGAACSDAEPSEDSLPPVVEQDESKAREAGASLLPEIDADDADSADDAAQTPVAEDDLTTLEPADAAPRFELTSMAVIPEGGDRGAAGAQFVVVTGPGPEDPRHLVVSVSTAEDLGEEDVGRTFVEDAADLEITELPDTGLAFSFLYFPQRPEDVELGSAGPPLNSLFGGALGPMQVVRGGANVLQPFDIEAIISALAAESDVSTETELPFGLEVRVTGTLSDGLVFTASTSEQASGGRVTVEVRDDVDRGWFEWLTWEGASVPIPEGMLQEGVEAAVPLPEYGFGGERMGDGQVTYWADRRLVTLTHSSDVTDATVVALYQFLRDHSLDELRELAEFVPGPTTNSASTEVDPEPEEVGPAPTVDKLAELQAFAESTLGLSAGEPLEYSFVDEIRIDGLSGFFVTAEMWAILVALDLVGPEHTRADADAARVERVRGFPGTVKLQADPVMTEVIVVHEMVHSLDHARITQTGTAAAAGRPEPVSASQALAEGNAHRVAFAYVDSLPADVQGRLPVSPAIFSEDGDPRLSRAAQDAIEFAYDEGHRFAIDLAAMGGEELIGEAFDRPPVSSEQILYPDAWVQNDLPVTVDLPDVADGESVLAEGSLGAFMLRLAIEADPSIDPRPILQHWAGDAYRIVDDGGTGVCLFATIQMDTVDAAAALVEALASDDRTMTQSDSTVELEACPA